MSRLLLPGLILLSRIKSAGMERMAFEQSSGGQVQGFQQAVFV
jgi:hypothetical protein